MKKQIKICFIGPSGIGKSTCSKLIQNKIKNSKNIKLADPLYQIQKYIYNFFKLKIKSQDGELLQLLGKRVQTLNKIFLAKEFLKKVKRTKTKIIINDDCRPHNYQYLKENGFVFVYIKSKSRKRKEDVSNINLKDSIEWSSQDALNKADFVINNKSSIKKLSKEIEVLLERIENGVN